MVQPSTLDPRPSTLDPRVPWSEPEVAAVVHLLNGWLTGSLLQRSLDCGGFLLDRFYGGDPTRFRRRGRKRLSLRRIAAHRDLAMSATTLWRMIAVAAQDRLLPDDVRRALAYPQRLALLPLGGGGQLGPLAAAAAAHGWSPAEIDARVRSAVPARSGGRAPGPRGVVYGGRLMRLAREARQVLHGASLTAAEVDALREARDTCAAAFAAWLPTGAAP